jgi:hypothetical protein
MSGSTIPEELRNMPFKQLWTELYEIMRLVGPNDVGPDLPNDMQIHDVINVSRLKADRTNHDPIYVTPHPTVKPQLRRRLDGGPVPPNRGRDCAFLVVREAGLGGGYAMDWGRTEKR